MGNGIAKIRHCFTGSARLTRPTRPDFYSDDSLGHSFCYVRPDPARPDPLSTSIFRSISGASVSANASTTPLSSASTAAASGSGPLFESSTSFASAPLHPVPKSGPAHDRFFLSGPIDRAGSGLLSGPLDRPVPAFSGPLDRASSRGQPKNLLRGGSHTLVRGLRLAISKTFGQSSVMAPVRVPGPGSENWIIGSGVDGKSTNKMKKDNLMGLDDDVIVVDDDVIDDDEMMGSGWVSENLQWAQGRAGEDRVHVVVSEDHGWVFVGIYDGFNGPDATDFLLSNLYSHVVKELKGLLWDECSKFDSFSSTSSSSIASSLTNSGSIDSTSSSGSLCDLDGYVGSRSSCCEELDGYYSYENGGETNGGSRKGRKWRSKHGGVGKKWGENRRKWKCEWDRERLELDGRLKEQWNRNESKAKVIINHTDVMKALAQALQKTEEGYFEIADRMLDENPELALMGSCVVVMLMKGEDVYVVNVGDSRAVLAQTKEPDLRLGMIDQDLERISEESMFDFHVSDGVKPSLRSVQLTMDHSTSVDEEVQRIRGEHPDDSLAVVNDRVKGSLKVTRAFGAGFLKQPKWNDALLEMFRINYVGNSPYINCVPSLSHHRLGPKDEFLLLSSDGLYQYFTNEEAVAEVELFISLSPEGDPAQHLVEEVLLRAAKKAGMDFYELLEIPQGDRRKYHDDVSIIIISFQGRIWRSCV